MGTAGAISMLPEINSGNLVVANCDLISNLDMNDLVQFHLESKSEATLAAATHKLQIPYGVLRHNAFGLFEKIEEKPVLSNYVAAGIYVFSAKFLRSNPLSGYVDMPHYIHYGQSNGMKISIFPLTRMDGCWKTRRA